MCYLDPPLWARHRSEFWSPKGALAFAGTPRDLGVRPSRRPAMPPPPPTLCSRRAKMTEFWLLGASLRPAASGTFPKRQTFWPLPSSSLPPLPDAQSRTRPSLPVVWGPQPGHDGVLRAGAALSSRETLKLPVCYNCHSRLPLRLRPGPRPVPEPAKAQQCEPVEPVSCINTSTPAAASLGGRNACSFNHTHCHPGLGQNFFLQGPWSHWVRTHP